MRALIQRVSRAEVTIEQVVKSSIGEGFLILLGVRVGDTREDADWLSAKIQNLRIFSDDEGKMNLSIKQTGGEILLISQFTLYADTRKGNRPGFSESAPPDEANALYEYMASSLRDAGISLGTGAFGADMQVSLINDGPVTILLDSEARHSARRSHG